MSAPLDRERVLDLWAEGRTGPEIAAIIGHPNWHAINGLIHRARFDGDPRAVPRLKPRSEKPRAEPKPALPARPDVTVRSVPNRSALGSTGPARVVISLPRLRCLEGEA